MKEDTIETNGGMADVEESRILLHHDQKTPFLLQHVSENAIFVTTRHALSIRIWWNKAN
jgi:hypothetical protein